MEEGPVAHNSASGMIIQLPRNANRAAFNSTNALLNRYFHEQVGQEIDKHVCTCFILTDEQETIKGYYTLSSHSIAKEFIPTDIHKKLKLPRYQDLPVILLGRLAIDQNFSRQGLGELLLMDALHRVYEVSRTAVAAFAIIVDPIDENAEAFYAKYGFIKLPGTGKMFLPMKTIAGLFAGK
jgi:predicted GNAT family N-acyltransferase